MKNIALLRLPSILLSYSFFALITTIASAQSNVLSTPEIWSIGGEHFSANDVQMSWTIGEVANSTISNDENILSQGFHQPEDLFLNVYGQQQQRIVITPNEDGLNDFLWLEEIANYPDHELIILNRWGSPVFRVQPYLNNWYGTNQSGEPLPEGTYYFLLCMDISQTEILYGSITIKR